MLIFVIGPSKAGKSTLLARATAVLSLKIMDLDAEDRMARTEEWGPGWEGRRWRRDVSRLAEVENEALSNNIVIDVGAGSLQTAEGRAYFLAHCDHTILVSAPWEIVLRRHPPGRNPTEFRNTEYSPERMALYERARKKIDTSSQDESEAMSHLVAAIQAILGQ